MIKVFFFAYENTRITIRFKKIIRKEVTLWINYIVMVIYQLLVHVPVSNIPSIFVSAFL